MSAEQLYQTIKDALHAFGLRFNDMHKVTVQIGENKVVYSFEDREYTVKI